MFHFTNDVVKGGRVIMRNRKLDKWLKKLTKNLGVLIFAKNIIFSLNVSSISVY